MENHIVIYTAIYPSQVHMAQSLLESAGIGSIIRDELTSQVIAFSTATGGVKLMVDKADAPRAIELLIEGGYQL